MHEMGGRQGDAASRPDFQANSDMLLLVWTAGIRPEPLKADQNKLTIALLNKCK
jgi:hypothetical protein